MPKPSSDPDVYTDPTLLMFEAKLRDEELSVEQARLQAAQMQAQMDAAIADADKKRAEQ